MHNIGKCTYSCGHLGNGGKIVAGNAVTISYVGRVKDGDIFEDTGDLC